MSDTICSSCGERIPDGQGRSCSMCYGDIGYGKDGYYRREVERDMERQRLENEDVGEGK